MAITGLLAAIWLAAARPSVPQASLASGSAPCYGGGRRSADGGGGGYGWGIGGDTRLCMELAAERACDPAGPDDLMLAFYTTEHCPEEIITTARQRGLARRVFGWSVESGLLTADGYHCSTKGVLGLLSLRLAGLAVGVGWCERDELDSPQARAQLALRRAVEDAGGSARGRPPSLILMSSTHQGDEEKTIEGLDAATGGGTPIMGGTAGRRRNHPTAQPSVIAGDRAIRTGLTVAVLYADRPVQWAFEGGFELTGARGRITASEGRVIHEIDHRPALEVYDEWSGGRIGELMAAGQPMASFCALHPLCRTVGPSSVEQRVFVHVWPKDGGDEVSRLVSAADLWPGDPVLYSEGTWAILLNRFSHLGRQARGDSIPADLGAALFICCEGIARCIPSSQHQQMAVLLNQSIGDVPWIGAFSLGEQGNFPGVGNHHGNLLTSLTLLPAGTAEE